MCVCDKIHNIACDLFTMLKIKCRFTTYVKSNDGYSMNQNAIIIDHYLRKLAFYHVSLMIIMNWVSHGGNVVNGQKPLDMST